MKTITCPSKEVPVIAETQVLVVGSGPAGISAAVASARCGAKTMLVERYGCFGGALFVGQVESYTWYFIAIQQIIANSRRNGTSLHSPAE